MLCCGAKPLTVFILCSALRQHGCVGEMSSMPIDAVEVLATAVFVVVDCFLYSAVHGF